MTSDEAQIRELIDKWMAASKTNDTDTVLSLMADDAVFMVPGREPFGKDIFGQMNRQMSGEFEGKSEIMELEVLGDWAWLRNKLDVAFTPNGGETMRFSGYVLTILKKTDGKWLLSRDANLLTPKSKG